MIKDIEELKTEFRERAGSLGLRVLCPMDGDFNAEIVIIGEGPGQQEVNDGRPMVGASGQLLWNSLRPYNILRPNVYTTNVCKRQISLAANTRHPVSAEEWHKWQHMLHWELQQLPNLKYVLCFGNAGLQALFGEDGITKFRGSVYPTPEAVTTDPVGKWTLITFNPAYVIRDPKLEIVFLSDIRRFSKVVTDGFEPYKIDHHINPSFAEARDWIKKMKASPEDISWDIEVISNETVCHGLADSGHEAMCINLRDGHENRYSTAEELQLLVDLQDLFDNKKIIAQNGNFDAHWCGYKDLLDVNIHFDTMLAHHTMYTALPHNLGFLTAQYTTHPFYKDDGKTWREGGDIDQFWRYNCKDAAITWECARLLKKELEGQKLEDFFYNHIMRLDKHLVRSTLDGIAVDIRTKAEITVGLKQDVEALREDFLAYVRRALDLPYYQANLNSQQQMKTLFFERLKLKTTTNSLDRTEREKLIDDVRTSTEARELLIRYGNYQRENKFTSTYAEMRVDDDNRFRTTWKQQGVTKAPGRLSSSGNLWGTASNAQNQPTRSQKFFISDGDPDTNSDEDIVFIYVDGSQAEARVVGYRADIDKWKEDFERARLTGTFDAHRALAADMYKIPYDEVPTEDWVKDESTGLDVPTVRYKGKRARHGLNYRMQFPRLAEAAKLSLYEAKRTFILYHNTNPQIKKWWEKQEQLVKRERIIFNALGRPFRILQRIDDEALESIIAFYPQSTIGDHVRRVWYRCHEDDEWDMSKMRIKLNVHDALIGLSKRSHAVKAVKIMKKHMEEPLLIQNVYKTKTEQCIIPGDVKISKPDEFGIHRWSTLDKVKL